MTGILSHFWEYLEPFIPVILQNVVMLLNSFTCVLYELVYKNVFIINKNKIECYMFDISLIQYRVANGSKLVYLYYIILTNTYFHAFNFSTTI